MSDVLDVSVKATADLGDVLAQFAKLETAKDAAGKPLDMSGVTRGLDTVTAKSEEVSRALASLDIKVPAMDVSAATESLTGLTGTVKATAGQITDALANIVIPGADDSAFRQSLSETVAAGKSAGAEIAGATAVTLAAPDGTAVTEKIAETTTAAKSAGAEISSATDVTLAVPDASAVTEKVAETVSAAQSAGADVASATDVTLAAPDDSAVTGQIAAVKDDAATVGQDLAASTDVAMAAPDASAAISEIGTVDTTAQAIGDEVAGSTDVAMAAPDTSAPIGELGTVTDAAQGVGAEIAGSTDVALVAPDVSAPEASLDGLVDTATTDVAKIESAVADVTIPAMDDSGFKSGLEEDTAAVEAAKAQLESFATSAEALAGPIGGIGSSFYAVKEGIEESTVAINAGEQAFNALARDLDSGVITIGEFSKAVNALIDGMEAVGQDASGLKDKMAGVGTEAEKAGAAASGAVPPFNDFGGSVKQAGESAAETKSHVEDLAGKLLAFSTALAVTEGLREFGMSALEAADRVDDATTALGALTGNAEQASQTIGELRGVAMDEALSFPMLLTASQRMTAFLGDSERVPEILAAVGNAAEVMSTSIETSSRMFGNMATNGDLSARSLRTLGLTMGDIAGAMGVTEGAAKSAFKELDQSERIGVLEQALSKFDGMAHKLSDDTLGNLVRMGTAFEQILEQIGTAVEPVTKALTGLANSTVVPTVKAVVDSITQLPAPLRDAVVGVGLLTAAIVPATAGVAALGLAYTGVVTGLNMFKAALVDVGIVTPPVSLAEKDLAASLGAVALSADGAAISLRTLNSVQAAGTFSSWSATAGTAAQSLGNIAKAAEEAAPAAVGFGATLAALGESIVAAVFSLPALAIGLGAVALNVGGSADKLSELTKTVTDVSTVVPTADSAINSMTSSLLGSAPAAKDLATAVEKVTDGSTALAKAMANAKLMLEVAKAGFQDGAITFTQMADAIAKVKAAQQALDEAFLKNSGLGKVIDEQTKLQKAIDDAKMALAAAKLEADGSTASNQRLAIANENLTKAQKALAGAMGESKTAFEQHEELIKKLANDDLPKAISTQQAYIDKLIATDKPASQVAAAYQEQQKMINKLSSQDLPAAMAAQQGFLNALTATDAPAEIALEAYKGMQGMINKLSSQDLPAAITAQEGFVAQLEATKAPAEVVRGAIEQQQAQIKKLASEDLPLAIAEQQQFIDSLQATGRPAQEVLDAYKAQEDMIKKLAETDLPLAIDQQKDFVAELVATGQPAGVVLKAYQEQENLLKKLAETDLEGAIKKQDELAEAMRNTEEPADAIRKIYQDQQTEINKLAEEDLAAAIEKQQQFIDKLLATKQPAEDVRKAYQDEESMINKLADTDLPEAIRQQQGLIDKMLATKQPAADVVRAYQDEENLIKKLAENDLPGAIEKQQQLIDKLIATKQPASEVTAAFRDQQGLINTMATKDLPGAISAQQGLIDKLVATKQPAQDVFAAYQDEESMINKLSSQDLPAAISAQQGLIDKMIATKAPATEVFNAYEAQDGMISKLAKDDLPAAIAAEQAHIDELAKYPGSYQQIVGSVQNLLQYQIQLAHEQGQDASDQLIALDRIREKMNGPGDSLFQAYKELQKVGDDTFHQLSAGFADLIIDGGNFGDAMISMAKKLAKELFSSLMDASLTPIKKALNDLTKTDFPNATQAANQTAQGIGGLSGAAQRVASQLPALGNAAASTVTHLDNLTGKIDQNASDISDLGEASQDCVTDLSNVGGAAGDSADAFGDLTKAAESASTALASQRSGSGAGSDTPGLILLAQAAFTVASGLLSIDNDLATLTQSQSAFLSALGDIARGVDPNKGIHGSDIIPGRATSPEEIAFYNQLIGLTADGNAIAKATPEQISSAIDKTQGELQKLQTQAAGLNAEVITAIATGDPLGPVYQFLLEGVNAKITTTETTLQNLYTAAGEAGANLSGVKASSEQMAGALSRAEGTLSDLRAQQGSLNQQLLIAEAAGNTALVGALQTQLGTVNTAITNQTGLIQQIKDIEQSTSPEILAAQQALTDAIKSGDIAAITKSTADLKAAMETQTVSLADAEKEVGDAIVSGNAADLSKGLTDLSAALAAQTTAQTAAELDGLAGVKATDQQVADAVKSQQDILQGLKDRQTELLGDLAIAVVKGDTDLENAINTELGKVGTQITAAQGTLDNLNKITQSTGDATVAKLSGVVASADQLVAAQRNAQSTLDALKAQAADLNEQIIVAEGENKGDVVDALTTQLGTVNGSIQTQTGILQKISDELGAAVLAKAPGYVAAPGSAGDAAGVLVADIARLQDVIKGLGEELKDAIAKGDQPTIDAINSQLNIANGQLATDNVLLGKMEASLGGVALSEADLAAAIDFEQSEVTRLGNEHTNLLKERAAAAAAHNTNLVNILTGLITQNETDAKNANELLGELRDTNIDGSSKEAAALGGLDIDLKSLSGDQRLAIDNASKAVADLKDHLTDLNAQLVRAEAANVKGANQAVVDELKKQIGDTNGQLTTAQGTLTDIENAIKAGLGATNTQSGGAGTGAGGGPTSGGGALNIPGGGQWWQNLEALVNSSSAANKTAINDLITTATGGTSKTVEDLVQQLAMAVHDGNKDQIAKLNDLVNKVVAKTGIGGSTSGSGDASGGMAPPPRLGAPGPEGSNAGSGGSGGGGGGGGAATTPPPNTPSREDPVRQEVQKTREQAHADSAETRSAIRSANQEVVEAVNAAAAQSNTSAAIAALQAQLVVAQAILVTAIQSGSPAQIAAAQASVQIIEEQLAIARTAAATAATTTQAVNTTTEAINRTREAVDREELAARGTGDKVAGAIDRTGRDLSRGADNAARAAEATEGVRLDQQSHLTELQSGRRASEQTATNTSETAKNTGKTAEDAQQTADDTREIKRQSQRTADKADATPKAVTDLGTVIDRAGRDNSTAVAASISAVTDYLRPGLASLVADSDRILEQCGVLKTTLDQLSIDLGAIRIDADAMVPVLGGIQATVDKTLIDIDDVTNNVRAMKAQLDHVYVDLDALWNLSNAELPAIDKLLTDLPGKLIDEMRAEAKVLLAALTEITTQISKAIQQLSVDIKTDTGNIVSAVAALSTAITKALGTGFADEVAAIRQGASTIAGAVSGLAATITAAIAKASKEQTDTTRQSGKGIETATTGAGQRTSEAAKTAGTEAATASKQAGTEAATASKQAGTQESAQTKQSGDQITGALKQDTTNTTGQVGKNTDAIYDIGGQITDGLDANGVQNQTPTPYDPNNAAGVVNRFQNPGDRVGLSTLEQFFRTLMIDPSSGKYNFYGGEDAIPDLAKQMAELAKQLGISIPLTIDAANRLIYVNPDGSTGRGLVAGDNSQGIGSVFDNGQGSLDASNIAAQDPGFRANADLWKKLIDMLKATGIEGFNADSLAAAINNANNQTGHSDQNLPINGAPFNPILDWLAQIQKLIAANGGIGTLTTGHGNGGTGLPVTTDPNTGLPTTTNDTGSLPVPIDPNTGLPYTVPDDTGGGTDISGDAAGILQQIDDDIRSGFGAVVEAIHGGGAGTGSGTGTGDAGTDTGTGGGSGTGTSSTPPPNTSAPPVTTTTSTVPPVQGPATTPPVVVTVTHPGGTGGTKPPDDTSKIGPPIHAGGNPYPLLSNVADLIAQGYTAAQLAALEAAAEKVAGVNQAPAGSAAGGEAGPKTTAPVVPPGTKPPQNLGPPEPVIHQEPIPTKPPANLGPPQPVIHQDGTSALAAAQKKVDDAQADLYRWKQLGSESHIKAAMDRLDAANKELAALGGAGSGTGTAVTKPPQNLGPPEPVIHPGTPPATKPPQNLGPPEPVIHPATPPPTKPPANLGPPQPVIHPAATNPYPHLSNVADLIAQGYTPEQLAALEAAAARVSGGVTPTSPPPTGTAPTGTAPPPPTTTTAPPPPAPTTTTPAPPPPVTTTPPTTTPPPGTATASAADLKAVIDHLDKGFAGVVGNAQKILAAAVGTSDYLVKMNDALAAGFALIDTDLLAVDTDLQAILANPLSLGTGDVDPSKPSGSNAELKSQTASAEAVPTNIITHVQVSGVLDNSSIGKISKGIAEHVQRLVPSTNRAASGRKA